MAVASRETGERRRGDRDGKGQCSAQQKDRGTQYWRGRTIKLSQKTLGVNLSGVWPIGLMVGGATKKIKTNGGKQHESEDETDATVVDRLARGWRVGGKAELSELREGGGERVNGRGSIVPHQPWDILRGREGKMREVPRVI